MNNSIKKIKKYYRLIRELPITAKQTSENVKEIKRLERLIESQIFGNNHANDNFYVQFENKFRGAESAIRTLQEYYLPYLAPVKKAKQTVVDIGSGRGEFLALLKDNGFMAIGVDLNKTMVEHAKKRGLTAVQEEANGFLKSQKVGTIGAICGFHIAEHIAFSDLLVLLRSSFSSLAGGGLIILETPNPESLLVGTHNFWLDPSHLNPVPPATLKFALESVGFRDVEIHRLHPHKESPNTEGLNDDLKAIVNRYYGPRDYSVIGKKPL